MFFLIHQIKNCLYIYIYIDPPGIQGLPKDGLSDLTLFTKNDKHCENKLLAQGYGVIQKCQEHYSINTTCQGVIQKCQEHYSINTTCQVFT